MSESESKIGLFLLTRDSSHQLAAGRAGEEAAARHRVPIEVSFADNLAVQQAQNIMKFVHANTRGRTCVILMPMADIDSSSDSLDAHPLHRLARRVAARGVGWIVLNRDGREQVTALRREFPAVPVALITPDQHDFGRVQGRQFRALLPRGGRILYVLGATAASSARDRRRGMLEVIGGDSAFSVEEVDGLWSRTAAREAVAKWLSHASPRGHWPDLVGCQNDVMAIGAREALGDAARLYSCPALREVPVTGGDGLPDEGQRWVGEGKIGGDRRRSPHHRGGRGVPRAIVAHGCAHAARDRARGLVISRDRGPQTGPDPIPDRVR